MARKPKRDPYLADAESASIVRYGPELSALTALLRAAEQSYGDRVRAARSARDFTTGAVDAARPRVEQAYSGAQAAITPAFAAQGGLEQGALSARTGEAQALAKSQLEARRVSAAEGFTAASDQALRDFRQDRGKIGDRSVDLAREIGAFTTQTAGELRGDAAAALAQQRELEARLGQDERESIRSSGFDPDTGLPLPGGKADPNRNRGDDDRWLSQEKQGAAADDIGTLQSFAEKLKGAGVRRGDAAAALLVGQEQQELPVFRRVAVKDAAGNVKGYKQEPVLNKDGTRRTRTVSAVPKASSKLLLKAALDQAYDGHLSRETQRLLHKRGIKIGPLGLTTFNEWLRTPEGREWRRRQRGPRTISRPGNAPGVGGSRPT